MKEPRLEMGKIETVDDGQILGRPQLLDYRIISRLGNVPREWEIKSEIQYYQDGGDEMSLWATALLSCCRRNRIPKM